MERCRFADVWHKEGEEDQRHAGVDVHAELKRGETEAGEDGEETIEAGQFVEYHREDDHFDARPQAHEV